jgi:hypothetical protein
MKTKCIKCGYESEENLEKFHLPICNICVRFAPNTDTEFKEYVSEKINHEDLKTFRKFSAIGLPQKKAMINKALHGKIMSRPPFGYKTQDKKLIPAENFREVEEIFEEFLNQDISLTQLAKKHNLSVNGLKKVLTNFTYIGKIKFNNQIHQGSHQAIISPILFNHVQNKIEKLKKN